ncbi:MAG TPA: SAM-dependent methyltransferase, partial [Candidatus Marinimicrobia bacterium]|nr:SAM-dependent methyltransferase [Candidatus Neomarinimicrobiota bacterium]
PFYEIVNLNLSKVEGEISWKKKLFFREEYKEDLHVTISEIAKGIKHNERFVIVTDYTTILAIDTKTNDKLDIDLKDLPKHFDFFLPWAGMEKNQHIDENPADVRAAEKMAKLFDTIKKDNPDDSPEFIHGLNVFLSRLLFCFFAEDTHIFQDSQFTNYIDSHTQTDGSDLNTYLDTLFTVLNTPEKERKNLPEYLNTFPYVNGGLFINKLQAPKFSRSSRAAILNSGDQDWSAINPDIFGSMFQAVISVDQRGSLGQHYTSVPNIMKVIEPLFLNELYEEFENANGNQKKLNTLLNRIHKLKIFDPACGSGNFLIIAYKELRILEMKIFKELEKSSYGQISAPFSNVHLSQFYGIEIDDFAGEIAKLALWLAEHQMNVEFFKEFGRTNPTLPLKEAGKIVQGNATRLDWEVVCPKKEGDEIYVLGNPPYLGARMQNSEQKSDMKFVFNNLKGLNNLDYISCWFKKGSDFIINSNSKYAFVTTNSISQGEQVSLLWPNLLVNNLQICFAHQSFKWTNNAKGNAGVTVAIIGIGNNSPNDRIIFNDGLAYSVRNINPYLVSGSNSFIKKRNAPLSLLPEMCFGSMANDGGNLLLSQAEKDSIVNSNPKAEKFIKKLIGSLELIRGINKYCIWIEDKELKNAIQIDEIKQRINSTKKVRLNSKREATQKLADEPYKFGEIRYQKTNSIIVPRVSSERRNYIPLDFLEKDTVISDSALAIYNAKAHHLGIITSRMHMTWMRTVAGRLEERYRYSSTLVYNTFPFPPISTQRKNEITQAVFRILEEREKHPEKTLAQLYDPDKMPDGLREAHRQNDEIIEKCYRSTPFKSDEERLEYLFKLYEQMIAEEKKQGTLFTKEKKTKKKR